MTHLKQVELIGFRSFRSVKVDLNPGLNVLIGANGAGKSNFIGAFSFMRRVVVLDELTEAISDAGGIDRLLHHGRKVSPLIQMAFRFGENNYRLKLTPTDDDAFSVSERIGYEFALNPEFEVLISRAHTRSHLKRESKTGAIARHVWAAISRWSVFHFHDTSRTAAVKGHCALDDNEVLRPDGGNLAAFLFSLRETEPAAFREIEGALRHVAPQVKALVLKPSKRIRGQIKVEWRHRASDAYFDAHALSDGTLRFLCLAALLIQPSWQLGTILLDEPELGLHPAAIRIVTELLGAASKHLQLVVATQSVALLNEMRARDVVVVEERADGAVLTRLKPKSLATWLRSYRLGQLWEKNVIGGRP